MTPCTLCDGFEDQDSETCPCWCHPRSAHHFHPEWEYVVCGYQGHGLYMARTLTEALEGIAREYARSEIKPKRTIMRRRKAGRWEQVALDGA